MLRKAQSGWFGVLDHFSFGCFLAGSPQSCGRAARRGRTEGGCGEGMMLGWTWTLQQPGSRPAPPASPGQMLWHQPAGLMPALPSSSVPRAGCVERLGLAPRSQAGACFVRGCRRNAVALQSAHATLDFSELPSGTICFAGVAEAACAATAGDTGRAFAAAVGFFPGKPPAPWLPCRLKSKAGWLCGSWRCRQRAGLCPRTVRSGMHLHTGSVPRLGSLLLTPSL